MNNEIKLSKKEIIGICEFLKIHHFENAYTLLDYITNLQQENKIKDTNWESLKYYLEKLYYKDYIEEAISDDIDKKIKELESKVEIKGYQKDIKALQQENHELKSKLECYENGAYYSSKVDELEQENERLKEQLFISVNNTNKSMELTEDYKSRCEKASEQAKEKIKGYKETIDMLITTSVENKRYEIAELRYRIREQEDLLNILQNGSDDNE